MAEERFWVYGLSDEVELPGGSERGWVDTEREGRGGRGGNFWEVLDTGKKILERTWKIEGLGGKIRLYRPDIFINNIKKLKAWK
jgi:hypothetical protein